MSGAPGGTVSFMTLNDSRTDLGCTTSLNHLALPEDLLCVKAWAQQSLGHKKEPEWWVWSLSLRGSRAGAKDVYLLFIRLPGLLISIS